MNDPIPYGGWPSPLDAAALAAGSSTLTELRSAGETLYWLESRPTEQGRTTLRCAEPTGAIRELTPAPINVRSRVHEYGGGAFLPTPAGVVFVNDTDGDVYLVEPGATPRRLTDLQGTMRLADFAWDAARGRLIAVCERNPAQGSGLPEATENLLVTLTPDLAQPYAGPVIELHRGHDFYAAPRIAPDGRSIAFIAWDHPNMPWDGSMLKVARFAADGSIAQETLIAGSAVEAVQQPTWTPDGALIFVSDQNGFWNLYRYDDSGIHCLLEDGAEYAEAPWILGACSVAVAGTSHLVACRVTPGQSELVLVDEHHGFASPLSSDWVDYRSLCWAGGAIAFIGGRVSGPQAIATLRPDTGATLILHEAELPRLETRFISAGTARSTTARDGGAIHANVYLPVNPVCAPEPDEKPPLLVMVHGGPTARSSLTLNLRVQYFTTRGWAVLDVDYRGSTGYGRRYRSALNGRWGVLDVADCEDAARCLIHEGLVDPRRIAIRGSSAGGFTVLSALADSHLFGAGVSLYGIGDLNALAAETHKFESCYVDTLVGNAAARTTRSPIRRTAAIRAPLLLLQGTEDRIVPPRQARDMVAALRARRVPVAYIEFSGEGHGFRKAHNVERALESEYAFYCRVFGIESRTPLASLEIENL